MPCIKGHAVAAPDIPNRSLLPQWNTQLLHIAVLNTRWKVLGEGCLWVWELWYAKHASNIWSLSWGQLLDDREHFPRGRCCLYIWDNRSVPCQLLASLFDEHRVRNSFHLRAWLETITGKLLSRFQCNAISSFVQLFGTFSWPHAQSVPLWYWLWRH
jgi:hypothetical protein